MKVSKYKSVINFIHTFVPENSEQISALANISAIINEEFSFLWCGFYLVKGESLVLGPFQGHPACSRIEFGKGVCGKAWKLATTIIVDDVNSFDGYIACSSLANSEIVVPVLVNNSVVAVIDIDSETIGCFDSVDKEYLQIIAQIVSTFFI